MANFLPNKIRQALKQFDDVAVILLGEDEFEMLNGMNDYRGGHTFGGIPIVRHESVFGFALLSQQQARALQNTTNPRKLDAKAQSPKPA